MIYLEPILARLCKVESSVDGLPVHFRAESALMIVIKGLLPPMFAYESFMKIDIKLHTNVKSLLAGVRCHKYCFLIFTCHIDIISD